MCSEPFAKAQDKLRESIIYGFGASCFLDFVFDMTDPEYRGVQISLDIPG